MGVGIGDSLVRLRFTTGPLAGEDGVEVLSRVQCRILEHPCVGLHGPKRHILEQQELVDSPVFSAVLVAQ